MIDLACRILASSILFLYVGGCQTAVNRTENNLQFIERELSSVLLSFVSVQLLEDKSTEYIFRLTNNSSVKFCFGVKDDSGLRVYYQDRATGKLIDGRESSTGYPDLPTPPEAQNEYDRVQSAMLSSGEVANLTVVTDPLTSPFTRTESGFYDKDLPPGSKLDVFATLAVYDCGFQSSVDASKANELYDIKSLPNAIEQIAQDLFKFPHP
jgi:hypothetical protein